MQFAHKNLYLILRLNRQNALTEYYNALHGTDYSAVYTLNGTIVRNASDANEHHENVDAHQNSGFRLPTESDGNWLPAGRAVTVPTPFPVMQTPIMPREIRSAGQRHITAIWPPLMPWHSITGTVKQVFGFGNSGRHNRQAQKKPNLWGSTI